jgi:hypothetical protein
VRKSLEQFLNIPYSQNIKPDTNCQTYPSYHFLNILFPKSLLVFFKIERFSSILSTTILPGLEEGLGSFLYWILTRPITLVSVLAFSHAGQSVLVCL